MDSGSLPERKLNPRQAAFVAEYLIDLNASQAAIRAGYAPDSTGEGTRLLEDARIRAAIEIGKAQRLSRVNITADSVLSEMSALAMSRVDHYVITDDGQVELAEGAPENAMAAIQSIKRKTTVKCDALTGHEVSRIYDVELRLWNKPEPLKLMGKHANVAACFDKVEVTGKDGGPIQHAIAAMPIEKLQEELTALQLEEVNL